MIIAALMFVLGAWNVQQLAQLPSLYYLLCASIVFAFILLTQYHRKFFLYSHHRNFHTHKLFKNVLLSAAAFVFGVCWASGFSLLRMSDELPRAWEQETIQIVGVVASVPEATEHGTRFRFDVEKYSLNTRWCLSISALINTTLIKNMAVNAIKLLTLKRL